MNKLPPTLREKHRYLRFQIHSNEKVTLGEAVEAIWDSVLKYMGSKDASEANPWIIGNRFDEEKQTGIVKVERSTVEDFRSALTLVEVFGDKKGFIEVKSISGTLESLE